MNAKQTLQAIYEHFGSWQSVAKMLGGGYSANTWRRIALGEIRMSTDADDVLRFFLRKPPKNASGRIERMRSEVLAKYLKTRTEILL